MPGDAGAGVPAASGANVGVAVSRVVVVGAGIGGLAAAARLAALGHDVTVCEAADQAGGKLGLVVQDVPGAGEFRFDTGPSLVTMPQVFRDLFADTGGWPDDLDLEPLDPVARYRFADGTSFDAGHDLHAALEAWSPGSGDDWRGFTARAQRVWQASRTPFLESPLDGPRTIARLALRQPRDIAAIAPGRSLRSLGKRYLRDPRLRMFLDRYATYTGSDPRRAPAALAAVPYVEQAYGGWYVKGGLHRLGTAIEQRAVERGARIRLSCRVSRILTTGGRASGVRLQSGEELPADLVVANGDAAHVYGDLVSAPSAAKRLARATPSLSGF
ncbi:MAG: UDP-galactopyranose mutase, partial [Frankiales bacterium]|nr:UDP-galactopyranose mutase [Frankiales bacterium]